MLWPLSISSIDNIFLILITVGQLGLRIRLWVFYQGEDLLYPELRA